MLARKSVTSNLDDVDESYIDTPSVFVTTIGSTPIIQEHLRRGTLKS